MKPSSKNYLVAAAVLIAVGIVGAAAFVYSGVYGIGADDPHTKPVYAALETLRDRSIAHHSADITVPDLSDPQLILKGAGQYAAMCTQCHLAPGMANSEIRPGLYPEPPKLAQMHVDPKEAFWVIKHGIKMSAMPAWGGSHDDPTIWSMVAFLQKLPAMTPAQYKDIVARAPPDDDMDGGGDEGHQHGHTHEHSGGSSEPSMPASTASPDHAHEPGTAPHHDAVSVPSSANHSTPSAVLSSTPVAQPAPSQPITTHRSAA